MLTPPAGACHYCHNPSDGREPTAPSHCTLCHDTVAPPVSHGAGWVAAHGAEARISTSSCDNCHKSSFCIDCHERKEGIQYKVHDATWLSVHGIAVQADPTSCGTCHLKADCVSCHATADGRAP